jgi:hypothetical protein
MPSLFDVFGIVLNHFLNFIKLLRADTIGLRKSCHRLEPKLCHISIFSSGDVHWLSGVTFVREKEKPVTLSFKHSQHFSYPFLPGLYRMA